MKYLLILQIICIFFLLTLLSSPSKAIAKNSFDLIWLKTIDFINKPIAANTESRNNKAHFLNKAEKYIYKIEYIRLTPLFEPINGYEDQ